jgi:hypothetical protein
MVGGTILRDGQRSMSRFPSPFLEAGCRSPQRDHQRAPERNLAGRPFARRSVGRTGRAGLVGCDDQHRGRAASANTSCGHETETVNLWRVLSTLPPTAEHSVCSISQNRDNRMVRSVLAGRNTERKRRSPVAPGTCSQISGFPTPPRCWESRSRRFLRCVTTSWLASTSNA